MDSPFGHSCAFGIACEVRAESMRIGMYTFNIFHVLHWMCGHSIPGRIGGCTSKLNQKMVVLFRSMVTMMVQNRPLMFFPSACTRFQRSEWGHEEVETFQRSGGRFPEFTVDSRSFESVKPHLRECCTFVFCPGGPESGHSLEIRESD